MKKLKTFVDYIDISQEQMAHELNLTQSAISKMLANTREPNWRTMMRIKELYNVSLDYLADDSWTNRPTEQFLAAVAEVHRAVKELGPDEVIRRITDQPAREYYRPTQADTPQPTRYVPPPYSPAPPPSARPLEPRHFNVHTPSIVKDSRPKDDWLRQDESQTGTEDIAPAKRGPGRPRKK